MGNSRPKKKLEYEDKVGLFDKSADYRVFITNNYNKFHLLVGNREIGRLGFIKKMLIKYGYMRMPILVNEFYEVIEGQHRLEACKELNVPIHYIVQPGLRKEHCIALNTGRRNWSGDDFLHSRAVDNEDFSYFERLRQKFPQYNGSIIMCTYDGTITGGNYTSAVKNGSLTCSIEDFNIADNILTWLSGFDKDVNDNGLAKNKKNIYCALVYAYKHRSVIKSDLTKRLHEKFAYFKSHSMKLEETVEAVDYIYNFSRTAQYRVSIYMDFYPTYQANRKGKNK